MNTKRCVNCMETFSTEYEICPYCGYFESEEVLDVNYLKAHTILNKRYTICKTIGAGGFGIIYSAWDNLLQTKVAIKEYFPLEIAIRSKDKISVGILNQSKQSEYDAGIIKFNSEAKIMALFNEASEFAHIYDYFNENNTAYLVMEYVDGITLEKYINSRKQIDITEAVNIYINLLTGLKKLHSSGYVHRDISPENIMVLDNGKIKILDLGAIYSIKDENTNSFDVIIKHGFAAPEQYNVKARCDISTDIYSATAVLYYMLTGLKPQYASERLLNDQLVKPSRVNGFIPDWLDSIVIHCMKINAEQRVKDIDTIIKLLDNKEKINIEVVETQIKNSKLEYIISAVCTISLVALLSLFVYNFSTYGVILKGNFEPLEYELYQCDDDVVVKISNPNDKCIAASINYFNKADEDYVIIDDNDETAYIIWLNEYDKDIEERIKIEPVREAKEDETAIFDDLHFSKVSNDSNEFNVTLYNNSDEIYNDINVIILGFKDGELVDAWYSYQEKVLPGGRTISGSFYDENNNVIEFDKIECYFEVD